MGLDVLFGGYVSYGYYIQSGKKIFVVFIYFQILLFKVYFEIGFIDYDKVEEIVLLYCFKIFICGGSLYFREWNYF